MNAEQKQIHARALKARDCFHKFELDFISILQDAERTKLYREFDKRSLHVYAVEILGFANAVAYMYIAVARRALEIPELLTSNLSVFVLSRLMSTINPENAAELIHIAQTKTSRELDIELGRRNPNHKPERTKILSEECVELTVKVSAEFLDKLDRVKALRAQKNAEAGVGFALEASLDEYLRRFDPVQKAERSQVRKNKAENDGKAEAKTKGEHFDMEPEQRQTKNEPLIAVADFNARDISKKFCAHRNRVPLTAEQRHAVFLRDQGMCTHVNSLGERCGSDRWVEVHHIIEVARGGDNEPGNLTTLCSFHHDRLHGKSVAG